MNKILVDGELININNSINDFIIKGCTKIYIDNYNEDISLNITLEDNSSLTVYDFNINGCKRVINVIQNNSTNFKYLHTFKINKEYNFLYNVKIAGNNNYNELTINGISNGCAIIKASANVPKMINNNIINENIKVLTIGGTADVMPIIYVDSLDVIANHNTAISNIDENELFYLMSKGIDEYNATSLIEKGILYSLFKQEEKFYEIIKK